MAMPVRVQAAMERAEAAGFELSCDPGVGSLLASLAATVQPGGRIVELGTGVGVGTAWLVEGLGARADVEIVTVEADQAQFDLVTVGEWPPYVEQIHGDGLDVLARLGPASVDLLFADCPAGKQQGLDRSVAALKPGGVLVVDDMIPSDEWPDDLAPKQAQVRETLLSHPDLVPTELDWSSGVIVATRRVDA